LENGERSLFHGVTRRLSIAHLKYHESNIHVRPESDAATAEDLPGRESAYGLRSSLLARGLTRACGVSYTELFASRSVCGKQD
jgi:hypothetical protein